MSSQSPEQLWLRRESRAIQPTITSPESTSTPSTAPTRRAPSSTASAFRANATPRSRSLRIFQVDRPRMLSGAMSVCDVAAHNLPAIHRKRLTMHQLSAATERANARERLSDGSVAEHVDANASPSPPAPNTNYRKRLTMHRIQQQRRDEHGRMLKGEFRSSLSPEKLWQALPDSGVKVRQIDRRRRRRNPLLHPQPLRRDAHHLRPPRHSASTQHPAPDRLGASCGGDTPRTAHRKRLTMDELSSDRDRKRPAGMLEARALGLDAKCLSRLRSRQSDLS